MTTLQEMLAAAPGAFDPVFVRQAADRAEDTKDADDLTYALRWLAAKKLWPLCRTDVSRFQWTWLRASPHDKWAGSDLVRRLRRAAPQAVLPQLVYDSMPDWVRGEWMQQYRSAEGAIRYLASTLRSLRNVVEVRP